MTQCQRKRDGIQCEQDAEFKVKIGTLWGHYCGDDTLEFMRSGSYDPSESPIYPEDWEVDEGGQQSA